MRALAHVATLQDGRGRASHGADHVCIRGSGDDCRCDFHMGATGAERVFRTLTRGVRIASPHDHPFERVHGLERIDVRACRRPPVAA
ncbi:MAG: hypothetical protein V9E93_13680 [Steroidobacteraceae bacterium]